MSAPVALRALPPRPSLEFERKEAKALLRRLRAGDADSIERVRARHPAFDPPHAKLADAQLTIAREYGFASWPRLVRWFEDVERPKHGGMSLHGLRLNEGMVRSLIAEHRDRRVWTARLLAAYVPRFYGMRAEDVFGLDVTEDEARLAIARSHGLPSWDALVERAEADRRQQALLESDPMRDAWDAMRAADVSELQRVIAEHPELLHPSEHDEIKGRHLLASALNFERINGREAMQPIVEWLASKGLDIQLVLNRKLCGEMRMEPEKVRWLLDRGADPNWVAPSGIPVLEHALLRYWNREAVDVLVERVVPRDALWIAAGLGDVAGVGRFLDRRGRPTAAARKLRPDFEAVGRPPFGALPDGDDEEILVETLLVAMLNGRGEVIEYLASRDAPIDSLVFGTPLVSLAVGNGWTDATDAFVRCGADLDLRGWRPELSAREIARMHFEQMPDDDARRRIAVLCGMNPDAILAERDARPVEPPEFHPMLTLALELAEDDAARLGQNDVGPENLLMGLARCDDPPLSLFVGSVRMDVAMFRSDMGDRVRPSSDRVEHPALPMRADAQAAIDAMFAIAKERRRGDISPFFLLYTLIRDDGSPVAELLSRYGADVASLRSRWEPAL